MKKASKDTAKKTCTKKTCKVAKCAAPKAKAAKPARVSVTFSVRAESGKKVFLAGTFNDWDPAAKKMTEAKKDGVYTTSVKLAPGEYQYKFVIDGVWSADPECADWVPNDQGTINSVITVK